MKYLEKIKQNSLYFALFLIGLSLLASCKTKYEVSKITGRKITVNANLSNDAQIESFIAPYAQKINQDMNRVLAFNPETLDKSIALSFGQSKMSNWFADVTFERTNLVLSLKKIKTNARTRGAFFRLGGRVKEGGAHDKSQKGRANEH